MSIKNPSANNIFSDPSLWTLLFSNLIAIYFATKEGWNLSSLMWVYWFQSIIIGFFNFIRILRLKEFSTDGFMINNQPAKPTHSTKVFTAFFFLFHYGFFHFAYLIFLTIGSLTKTLGGSINTTEFKSLLVVVFLFFLNHLFSYIYSQPKDTKKQNIGALMFYPYARIIPMHLTIILGLNYGHNVLFLFLGLKTLADIIMHIIEHAVIRKGEEPQTQESNI